MTDFLFNSPTFLGGVATVLDIFGMLPAYNSSETPKEADRRAHYADVLTLRKDMEVALAGVSAYEQK